MPSRRHRPQYGSGAKTGREKAARKTRQNEHVKGHLHACATDGVFALTGDGPPALLRASRLPKTVTGSTNHPGRSGHTHREGALSYRALLPHASAPRRRCGRRYAPPGEQRVRLVGMRTADMRRAEMPPATAATHATNRVSTTPRAKAWAKLMARVGDVVVEARTVEGQAKPQMVARFTIDTVPAIAALQRGKMVGADGPPADLWEILNGDRWIIPARPGEVTPARPKITVRLEYDRRAAVRNRHGRGEDVA